ncbi:hypothetical protein EG328_001750 [Venturia inaequalis]|uniref:EH domain-containing protein n=1 Tax=Venturia inaequalis TaxID=5025 RepID=A0A8H3UVG4_VENIN|nr:hypothetical protein EG328_001750 [Venturia inaequalis]
MTTASPTRSNNPSRSSTPHNVPNAALIASTRAFAKTAPKTPPLNRTLSGCGSGSNGALSAAKSVHSASSTPTRRSSMTSSTTTTSIDERDIDWELTLSERRAAAKPYTPGRPSPAPRRDSGSGLSFLAANTATASSLVSSTSRSRFPSPLRSVDNSDVNVQEDVMYTEVWDPATRTLRKTVKPAPVKMAEDPPPRRRRRSNHLDDSTDGTSIAPTTSLVKLFEQQNLTGGMKPDVSRKPSMAKGKPPPIFSPKPQRIQSLHCISPELDRPTLKPSPKRVSSISIDPMKATREENGPRPVPTRSMSIPSKSTTSSDKPALPPPRRPRTKNPDYKDIVSSSVGSSPVQKLRIPATQHLQPQRSGTPVRADLPSNPKRSTPAPYKDTYIKTISPHITGDSLANAMVGANLAIRNSPPRHTPLSKTPPPIPAPRRKKDHDHHLGGVFHRTRSHSPPKKQPMVVKTLREDKTGDSEILKNHKFRHPNKHHEATRERWQDKVDAAALKRYEGVWASNKGIYIQDPAATNEVAGIAVREIWSRSGLSTQKLAQIWVLVGGGGTGSVARGPGHSRASLTKEQFVVGMYFIDMVLKGRNLPQVVGESVWNSVRASGLSIAIKRR